MEELQIFYEKLTRLLESQRCFLLALNKSVIIRDKHYDEAFENACEINFQIAKIFDLKPKDFKELMNQSQVAVKENIELEKLYSMDSPH